MSGAGVGVGLGGGGESLGKRMERSFWRGGGEVRGRRKREGGEGNESYLIKESNNGGNGRKEIRRTLQMV